MKKITLLFVIVFTFFSLRNAYATHNRAGEITYKFVGVNSHDRTYEVTITTYTKLSNGSIDADRPSLDSVYWGDSYNPTQFIRQGYVDLPNDIRVNTYVKRHTYLGSGHFIIHVADPNRNANIRNIPHSVNVPFYLESLLVINDFLGPNNSPILDHPPIDQGCVGRIFKHNPAAHDPDPNDSLSYELVFCGGNGGLPIPGYSYPAASHSLTLNPVTGDLIWDSPLPLQNPPNHDEYNIAFNIIEWRSGLMIGYVRRDMQIVINDCDDNPPVLNVIADTCVLAGDTLTFDITALDTNHNAITLTASGGILDSNFADPAHFVQLPSHQDTAYGQFSWLTKCHHIRPQPYFVLFEAATNSTSPVLVDLKGTFIHVIPPAPPTITAVANGSAIDLHWAPAPCSGNIRYNIYRRNEMYPGTIQCPCENGVPSNTGFVLIGKTPHGDFDTTFTDNNNGQGLTIGIQYCYMVTAVYQYDYESCASPQACATLKKDAPVITNADVRFTDTNNGSVFVGWSKPTELDTSQFRGPYQYRVYHSPGFFSNNFSLIGTLNDLNDTAFIDTFIDTKSKPWLYKVELYYTDTNTTPDSLKLKGQTAIASTIFLTIAPTDNRLNLSWKEYVPWNNLRYDIFRQNASLAFDSIASVTTPFYSDSGLANLVQQCYYIRSSGSYSFSGFIDPILNRSQIDCEMPVDNIHPCSPSLSVLSDCNDNLNQLTWTNPNNSCADDVLKYYIYFSSAETGDYILVDSVLSPVDTVFLHKVFISLAGCYRVTAVDSVGNETLDPVTTCVDTCRQYTLPSVFTPDGDGKNDLFHPCDSTTSLALQTKNCPPYKNVRSVEMKIYNRWGSLVYETSDKNINWDGKYKDTKNDCPDGVYFYTCKVYFFSVTQQKAVDMHGTIQLIRKD